MNVVTKDFPVIAGDATDEYPHGSFEVILSAPTLDRDNEIVDEKAFEPLPERISFDTDHSMTCDSVVGSGKPYYAEDGTLRVKGGYCSDERSQVIRTKVAEGHITTTSVTFMTGKRQKDANGVMHIVSGELLNGTFTPVPSNREAVVLAAKSVVAKAGRRNSAADQELVQSAHDAMASLGASCTTKSLRGAEGKAIVGSVEALQERVSDALEGAYGNEYDYWGYLRGVIPNAAGDGGTVVFQSSRVDDGWNSATYQQTYTDDGLVVTLTGDAVEVDIHEIVTPDADADRESSDDTLTPAAMRSAADAADSPAAPDAAGKSAAEAADTVPDEVKAATAARRNQLSAAFL